MSKTFFIFYLNTKSKILRFGLGELNIYHNLGDFTWRVSDCEGLMGVTHR